MRGTVWGLMKLFHGASYDRCAALRRVCPGMHQSLVIYRHNAMEVLKFMKATEEVAREVRVQEGVTKSCAVESLKAMKPFPKRQRGRHAAELKEPFDQYLGRRDMKNLK